MEWNGYLLQYPFEQVFSYLHSAIWERLLFWKTTIYFFGRDKLPDDWQYSHIWNSELYLILNWTFKFLFLRWSGSEWMQFLTMCRMQVSKLNCIFVSFQRNNHKSSTAGISKYTLPCQPKNREQYMERNETIETEFHANQMIFTFPRKLHNDFFLSFYNNWIFKQ